MSVAAGSNLEISGARIQANPAVFNGPGLASVTETFLPEIDNDSLIVFDFGDGDIKLSDETTFANTMKTVSVQKDIVLRATGETGAVTIFSEKPLLSTLAISKTSNPSSPLAVKRYSALICKFSISVPL